MNVQIKCTLVSSVSVTVERNNARPMDAKRTPEEVDIAYSTVVSPLSDFVQLMDATNKRMLVRNVSVMEEVDGVGSTGACSMLVPEVYVIVIHTTINVELMAA